MAGGAVLEATTGIVSKTFGKKRSPRKAKKATAKRKSRKSATKRKPTTRRKKAITRKKTTRKSVGAGSAINKTTGRLKRGFKYAKGGRIVRTKKK